MARAAGVGCVASSTGRRRDRAGDALACPARRVGARGGGAEVPRGDGTPRVAGTVFASAGAVAALGSVRDGACGTCTARWTTTSGVGEADGVAEPRVANGAGSTGGGAVATWAPASSTAAGAGDAGWAASRVASGVGSEAGGAAAATGAGVGSAVDGGGAAAGGGAACARTGNSDSGSRYPSASAARRTPRWTCGWAFPRSALAPTAPTEPPSSTAAPVTTSVEPSCSSVTAYPSEVRIVTARPPFGTLPTNETVPRTGARTLVLSAAPTSMPRCWPAAYGSAESENGRSTGPSTGQVQACAAGATTSVVKATAAERNRRMTYLRAFVGVDDGCRSTLAARLSRFATIVRTDCSY